MVEGTATAVSESRFEELRRKALELQSKANVAQSRALELQRQAMDYQLHELEEETAALREANRDAEVSGANDTYDKINRAQTQAFNAQREAIQELSEGYKRRRKILDELTDAPGPASSEQRP